MRGFVLIDPYIDYKSRYNPPAQGVLDIVTTALYIVGMGVSLLRWRETAIWWCIFWVGIGITQVFATGTPDGARAIGFAPFMYLFVAMGMQALFWRLPSRWGLGAIAAICVITVGTSVLGYVNWMSQTVTLDARKPAIELADYPAWADAQMKEIEAGHRGFDVQQWTPGLGLGGPRPADLPRKGQALGPVGIGTDLGEPRGVAADSAGDLYVADARVARWSGLGPDGSIVTTWKVEPDATPPVEIWDIAVDPAGGVWVLDTSGRGAIHYSADGRQLGQVGQDLAMFRPRGIAVDPAGRVYIADTGHARVLQLDAEGHTQSIIGGEGLPTLAQPTDVAIATDGSIFVAEPEQSQVKKFDPQGAYVGAILLNRSKHRGRIPSGLRCRAEPAGRHRLRHRARGVLSAGPVTARLC